MCSSKPWIVALLAVASAGACAADDESDATVDAPLDIRSQFGGAGTTNLTRTELSVDSRAGLPGFRSEASELGLRWWSTTGRAAVGLGVGTIAYALQPVGPLRPGSLQGSGVPGDMAQGALAGAGTVLTLGMRYRTSERSTLYADAAGVRGLGLERDAVVGKVGVEFKAAQSRFNIAYGGLGLQLAGDTKMTLRLRRGGLAVYMRSAF